MDAEALREAIRAEAMAELWRRRQVWPLLAALLDRDQLADARAFFEGGDAEKGILPPDDWVDNISRQRGKSWKWCVIAVTWAHCHRAQFIKYSAQLGKSVRGIIQPTINALLRDMPREYRATESPEYIREDKVDHKWEFPNGSEIMAAGVNLGHHDDLRGPKSHLIIQDECGFYDDFDAVQRVLRPQTQTTKGVNVYTSTPPESPGHPFTPVSASAKARGRYVHRTIYNHPRMTKEEVDAYLSREAALKGQTLEAFKRTTYYRREFLCLHVVEEARAVVPEWSGDAPGQPEGTLWGDTLVVPEVRRPLFYDTYDSTDFGYTRDPHAAVFGYYDFSWATLTIEDETPPLYRARTDALAKAIKEKRDALWPTSATKPFPEAESSPCGKHWLPYKALGDGSGRGLETIQELAKDEELHLSPSIKAELVLRVNKLRTWVASGRVRIHKRCIHLREQLAQGLWADKAKTEFERTTKGHLDHLAALTDLVWNLDDSRNPVPVGYGFDHMLHAMPSMRQRGAVAALENAFGGD